MNASPISVNDSVSDAAANTVDVAGDTSPSAVPAP